MKNPHAMFRISCLAALMAISFDAAALSLSKQHAGVLVSEQGTEVVVAPSSLGGSEVLVQVKGVKDPIDNVVLLTTPNDISSRGDKAYRTTLWGSGYAVLIARNEYSNSVQYQLILPSGEEQKLWLDEKKSKALKPEDLMALYTQQKKQGTQEKLAQFNRDKLIEREQLRVKKVDDEAAKTCGAPIKTTVDWPSINDANLRELSVSGYCQVAERLASECRNKPDFKPQAVALGNIECRFGSEMKLRMVDGKVVFTTHREASNLEDFIRSFLRNQ